ncbi:molecular chaperone HscC [Anaerovorax odorimutans]|uniref:Chaperone protein DnaK n=1 Tax=Anaerovorax odorimutans TaxID=109327 RepID=A0ABT1RQU9_9FIRM|nr:molecular chaperone HscC [Anaerovorax odorimutans]MCQ4637555.1 molecular chaperone HscC [Anaerovorax odorimutans]
MKIGIDLGTTNSLVAYYTDQGPKIIPNRLGENLTPSIVSVDEEGMVYVGKTAKERMSTFPDMTASLFKRSMGTEKEFSLGNSKFRAEELSSLVLRALKEDAESYLGEPVTEAVISVPAYFNDIQRKATKRAGELAGLTVERIINEPTAAAIAYGLHNRADHTRFLVFDLGGGTFDISILERYGNIMEVRAIAGDNFIGGEDFTRVLCGMMLHENGIDEDSLTAKEQVYLQRQAEACKLGFSDSSVSSMKCVLKKETYEREFSLEEYERNCQLLLTRIRKPIERSLKDANVRLADIDEIVLVGGATKLPIIRNFVGRIFGRIPNTDVNPDEAIAMGAAIQCAMKERNQAVREVVLTEVCPFTLGTSVAVQRLGEMLESGHFLPIIERNTVIPVSRTNTLYTAGDFQRKITVDILQGESRFAKNNLLLGEITVPVPAKKAGEESIDVTYTYDINSILEVKVKVNSTGVTKKMVIQKEGSQLTKEEAEKRMEELNYLKIHPREQEANKLLLFRGERLYEEATGDLRQEIDFLLSQFEAVLDKQDQGAIDQARGEVKEALDEIEAAMEDDLFD